MKGKNLAALDPIITIGRYRIRKSRLEEYWENVANGDRHMDQKQSRKDRECITCSKNEMMSGAPNKSLDASVASVFRN
jgi:hypothetical protein